MMMRWLSCLFVRAVVEDKLVYGVPGFNLARFFFRFGCVEGEWVSEAEGLVGYLESCGACHAAKLWEDFLKNE